MGLFFCFALNHHHPQRGEGVCGGLLMFTFSLQEVPPEQRPLFAVAEFAHGDLPLPVASGRPEELRASLRRIRANDGDDAEEAEARLSLKLNAGDLVFHGDQLADAGSKFLVGVVRKKSRTVELLPSDAGALYVMHQRVKGYTPAMPAELTSADAFRLSELSSHRSRKRVTEAAKFSLRGKEVVVAAQTDALLDAARESAPPPVPEGSSLPPHDAQTTDARAVYSMATLLGEELRDALEDKVVSSLQLRIDSADALDKYLRSEDAVAPFVREWLSLVLRDVRSSTDSAERRKERLLAVAFVLLASFYLSDEFPKRGAPKQHDDAKPVYWGSRLLGSDWKQRLVPKMHRDFAEKSLQRYTLGDRLRARVMNYASVAMMLAMPHPQVDLRHVCDVMQLDEKHARTSCLMIGATTNAPQRTKKDGSAPASADAAEVYVLKAPLKLPKVRFAKKKK